METFKLGSFDVPRLFAGLWQLSGNAWGTAPAVAIRQEISRHVEKGFFAFGTRDTATLLLLVTQSN